MGPGVGGGGGGRREDDVCATFCPISALRVGCFFSAALDELTFMVEQ